ncbi:MAG: GNAT family N-acetyltransferase [Lachnospiraceae bacterium]|nr:GNAT family N-acetyltransferase [Lachnospiraceae bacterium]
MKIRKLKITDAPRMLEWMHSEDTIRFLRYDFEHMQLDNCRDFIINSNCRNLNDLHYAITDDEDCYSGTVSLKHVDHKIKAAELAIVLHPEAMGKGYSSFGISELFKIAKEKSINYIYWCVDERNTRAIRFYEKMGFKQINIDEFNYIHYLENKGLYSKEEIDGFRWYGISI